MGVTNVQRLTRGDRKYAAKKKAANVEEVKFDPESRTEFLTGFHKRKLARQAEGRRKAEELNRQQRLIERRKIREERRKEIEAGLGKLKEAEDIIEGRTEIPTRSTKITTKKVDEDSNDEDFNGFEETSGILKRRDVKFGDSNVTFEEVNLDPFVDISRSEEVLDEATRKANEYAAYVSSLDNVRPEPKQKVSKPKPKKFRYLPKSERKMLNKKSRTR